MIFILLRTVISALRSHRALALESLALRHQLEVLKRNTKRPHLTDRDRVPWVFLSRRWANLPESLTFVQPETVIRWRKRGFRLYWRWKSRQEWLGRRTVPKDVRDLIRGMSRDNPLWGVPRIHGELLKLGVTVSQATVCALDRSTDRGSVPMGHGSKVLASRSRRRVRGGFRTSGRINGHQASADLSPVALAESIRRKSHWIHPPRVCGSHDYLQ